MTPEKLQIPSFIFAGISAVTGVAEGRQTIGHLWERFMSEHMMEQIKEWSEGTIMTLYTDYEGTDGPREELKYRAMVGCRVRNADSIPDGMERQIVPTGIYATFLARGMMPAAELSAWEQIHTMNLDRTYIADWDVYGPKSQNGELSEVEIFVSIKE
jgi:predicted transcriptional regulator YdeE